MLSSPYTDCFDWKKWEVVEGNGGGMMGCLEKNRPGMTVKEDSEGLYLEMGISGGGIGGHGLFCFAGQ